MKRHYRALQDCRARLVTREDWYYLLPQDVLVVEGEAPFIVEPLVPTDRPCLEEFTPLTESELVARAQAEHFRSGHAPPAVPGRSWR